LAPLSSMLPCLFTLAPPLRRGEGPGGEVRAKKRTAAGKASDGPGGPPQTRPGSRSFRGPRRAETALII